MEPVRAMVIRGLMEGLILHAIHEEPSHGYGIITKLDSALGERPNKNQVYPLLHELEEEGHIHAEPVDEDGRQKQVYRLTPQGENRLRQYGSLPQPFKTWISGLFNIENGSTSPSQIPAPEPEPQSEATSQTNQPHPPLGTSWVPNALGQLPAQPPIQAPFATIHLDKDPNEGSWTLRVDKHSPGNYARSDECPLTFLYLAVQQLLFSAQIER